MSRKSSKPTKPAKSESSRVVVYARVSTSKQGDDGVSLSAQVEKCRQYAALYGLEVIEVIEDVGSAAMQHMRSRGEYTGGHVPYGFALAEDGRLVPCDQEIATQARARELGAQGKSLRAVAKELAAEGRMSRTGRPFAAVQIQRIIAQ